MTYFRQSEPITLDEQKRYMEENPEYNGNILYVNGKKVGVFALHKEELCIVAPLEYHALGINLLRKMYGPVLMHGDVMVGNPALPIYLNNGFAVHSVKEKSFKKHGHWVPTIRICGF